MLFTIDANAFLLFQFKVRTILFSVRLHLCDEKCIWSS